MSKYTKPTISFISLNATAVAASNCSASTTDAKEIEEILKMMGADPSTAFASTEACGFPFDYEGYCKFTSSIQVFYS